MGVFFDWADLLSGCSNKKYNKLSIIFCMNIINMDLKLSNEKVLVPQKFWEVLS